MVDYGITQRSKLSLQATLSHNDGVGCLFPGVVYHLPQHIAYMKQLSLSLSSDPKDPPHFLYHHLINGCVVS